MILRMGVPATRKLRGFSDSPDPSRSAHNRRISSAADGVVCDPPPSSTATASSMESRQPLSKVSRIESLATRRSAGARRPMRMLLKILQVPVSVFSLIVASALPGSAQTNVFVNGNTSFTVTWQGEKPGATLLATATFTVSNWSGTSFVMTVTNVRNTMPTSPNINARLTAFGFGLTPEGTFSNLVAPSIYTWAFANFPAFQRVDVCLTSGSGCAGGGSGGLNQGQGTNDIYSVTATGNFANGVTVTPIPAKFQTSLGSLETDGVVIYPPPSGASDLTIAKDHNPGIAIPGDTVTYIVTVSNVGSSPSSGTVTVTETPPPGLTIAALF